jgi:cystathionine beta-lyase/cystathionine gamma-synthase
MSALTPERLSAILGELGEVRDDYFGAVAPPLIQTSNFAFPSLARMREQLKDEYAEYFYTRGNNPTVHMLRQKLAALEGAEAALVFASGAGAMAAAVLSFVRQGDELICIDKPYSWTRILLRDWLPRFGIQVRFVRGSSAQDFAEALSPRTRMIVLESPNSMTFEQQELAAIAKLARSHNVLTLVDNSYASPLFQRPITLGIDLVMHSATKYLNGHSDVVAGVVCGSEHLIRQIFKGPYMTFGAIAAPFDAWLMLRGLRTLELRMQRISQSALEVQRFLRSHPKVKAILSARENDELLAQSGMFSVELLAPDVEAVARFCDALKYFLMAVSWGGHESLIFPLACVTDGTPESGVIGGLPFSLVRLSIGLEAPSLLIADLAQALERI